MAETPASSLQSPPPPPPPTPPSLSDTPNPTQYWCYQCDKRVPIETLPDQPDVICFECKNGFVELISVNHHQPEPTDDDDQPAFGHEFLQVLRLIAQAAREDDAPPLPPPAGNDNDNDYLRIELDGWNENDNDNDDEEEDDDEDDNQNQNQVDPDRDGDVEGDGSDDDDDEEEPEIYEDEEVWRRQRRDVIRLQLRDFATRALSRRNRILDWGEILMGLEDHSIEFRFQVPGGDRDGYVGNPGDYVDAAGYEALLQTLAESDNGGRRGAPPAAKSVVEGLPTVEVKSKLKSMSNEIEIEFEVCSICKDKVFNNEKEIVKELPCGHLYHEDCIVPWLGARNTCPICRFELPTDDPEYEDERKKRSNSIDTATTATTTSSSTASGYVDGDGI